MENMESNHPKASYKVYPSLSMLCGVVSCFLIWIQSYSQSSDITQKLELLQEAKKYCQGVLKMDIPDYFFKNWSRTDTANFYLYVSKKDTLNNLLSGNYVGFGNDLKKAQIEKHKYDSLEFHTLLYSAYGDINTLLSNHLLSYSIESISFIAFHEAAHLHIRANAEIPYIIEEAASDLVANYGTLEFFSTNKMLSKKAAAEQIELIEGIGEQINSYLKILESVKVDEFEADYSELKVEIEKLCSSENEFVVERYNYEINNAYFLRYRSYTKYYFKLKELLILNGNLRTFLKFIVGLPNDEFQGTIEIDKQIIKLLAHKKL